MKRHSPTQRAKCVCGKYRYSKNEATAMARRINHDQPDDWPVHAYHCDQGAAFHVGHLPNVDVLRRKSRRVR